MKNFQYQIKAKLPKADAGLGRTRTEISDVELSLIDLNAEEELYLQSLGILRDETVSQSAPTNS